MTLLPYIYSTSKNMAPCLAFISKGKEGRNIKNAYKSYNDLHLNNS
jgi:hypothetical protein